MALKLLERGFIILLFLYLMGAATTILYADVDQETYLSLQGGFHWDIALVQLSIAGIAAALILMRLRRVAGAAVRAWPLFLLLGVQFCSVVWSIEPILTLRRSTLELLTLVIGVYLGERYTCSALAKLVSKVLLLAMAIIVGLSVVAPRLVFEADQHRALRGLAQNKNGFGFYIGLTVALLLLTRFKKHDWLRTPWLLLALAMLLLSHSMTSVASAAAILVTLPFWMVARLPPNQRVAGYLSAGAVLVGGGYLAAVNSGFLLSLMGRDSTLTGRTAVWKQLTFAIQHHPWLGYGYGAFWTGLRGESLDVLITSGWIVPSAHNAYLELCLAMGIPGILVTFLIFWNIFRLAIRHIRTEPGWIGLWPIACILFILVHGLGESQFIFDSSFASCLFTALYTSLALERRRAPEVVFRVSVPANALAAVSHFYSEPVA